MRERESTCRPLQPTTPFTVPAMGANMIHCTQLRHVITENTASTTQR